jgi:hypothetical protein
MRILQIKKSDNPQVVQLKTILNKKNLSINGAHASLNGIVTVRTLYRWLDGASDINYVLYNKVIASLKTLKENI